MRRSKRTQHRTTERPQHRTKRTFEGQKGQNEAIQDKRAERAPLALRFFPERAFMNYQPFHNLIRTICFVLLIMAHLFFGLTLVDKK